MLSTTNQTLMWLYKTLIVSSRSYTRHRHIRHFHIVFHFRYHIIMRLIRTRMNQNLPHLFQIHLHQHPPHLLLKTKTLTCISAKKKQSRVPKKNLKQSIEMLFGTGFRNLKHNSKQGRTSTKKQKR